jgi:glycosyltransferase involved in cell wall biosynthesis
MYDLPAGLVARSIARRLGVPYVVSLHGTDVNSVLPRRVDLYADVLTGAAATIYVSAALRDRAQQLVGPHPHAQVIPNGVDPAVFRPGVRADLPTVLYVGNLEKVKGADRLPAIWREVRARMPEALLRVVGTGSLLTTVRRALDDPSVTFLGRLDQAEVAQEMGRAHVLVLPSRSEGWPTVIMEAYATGTPVVGTSVGGIPEAVVDPACLVAEGPALEERFAEAVVRVLGQPARGPEDALRDVALDHTWDAVAAREIEVYRSC